MADLLPISCRFFRFTTIWRIDLSMRCPTRPIDVDANDAVAELTEWVA